MLHREDVVRQAMASPVEDRAYVVTILERSLASPDSTSTGDSEIPADGLSGSAFLAELERRSAVSRRHVYRPTGG